MTDKTPEADKPQASLLERMVRSTRLAWSLAIGDPPVDEEKSGPKQYGVLTRKTEAWRLEDEE